MDSPHDPRTEAAVPGTELEEGRPPLFSTWGRLYGAVIIYLAVFIVFLYLFTEYYQLFQ